MNTEDRQTKLLKNLRKVGFYANECKYIFKNFKEERIKEALHYYWWLSKFMPTRKYEKSYIYALFNNFDLSKTYLEYQKYLKNKKSASKVAVKPKKSYIILDKKVGEDAKLKTAPRNILEFIRDEKKSKDS